MSSYLNIYGILKSTQERVLIFSISRSNTLYSYFNDSLNIPFIGDDTIPKVMELHSSDVDQVMCDIKEELSKATTRLNEFEKHADGNIEVINEVLSMKEYVSELETDLIKSSVIWDIVRDSELQCTGFSSICCNID
jgi:hypothetical protein